MNPNHHLRLVLISLAALVFGGCGGSTPPPRVAIEPVAQPETQAEPAPVPAEPEPEPDIPLEERWNAPFAVSSAGRAVAREPRRVVVIGADPSIAEAIAELHGGDAVATADEPDPSADRSSDGDDAPGAPSDVTPGSEAPSVESDEADAPDAPTGRIHSVGRGDTLWGIARRYGVTTDQIRQLNDLADDRIRPGQTLIIPAPDDGS